MAEKRRKKSTAQKVAGATGFTSHSMYSVNGKYRAELLHNEDGWVCRIWARTASGSGRPVIANLQPFASSEQAIYLVQKIFARYTGDDRYFDEEIWKANSPNNSG